MMPSFSLLPRLDRTRASVSEPYPLKTGRLDTILLLAQHNKALPWGGANRAELNVMKARGHEATRLHSHWAQWL